MLGDTKIFKYTFPFFKVFTYNYNGDADGQSVNSEVCYCFGSFIS